MYIIAEKIKMKASTGVVAMAAVREKEKERQTVHKVVSRWYSFSDGDLIENTNTRVCITNGS